MSEKMAVVCRFGAEIKENQLNRRNLSDATRDRLRAERAERVSAARAQGRSLRAIADQEQVSEKTVRNDLAKSTAEGSAVDPPGGIVVGKDGKLRKAKILCARCQRVGEVKDCSKCREARATRRKRMPKLPAPPVEGNPTDAFGNPLPARCRDAFLDPWLQQTYDMLREVTEKVRAARLETGSKKRERFYPFVLHNEFRGRVRYVMNQLQKLIEQLEANRPAGVCPACHGKGCAKCQRAGMVPRAIYHALQERQQ
jgi:hypothetical protein